MQQKKSRAWFYAVGGLLLVLVLSGAAGAYALYSASQELPETARTVERRLPEVEPVVQRALELCRDRPLRSGAELPSPGEGTDLAAADDVLQVRATCWNGGEGTPFHGLTDWEVPRGLEFMDDGVDVSSESPHWSGTVRLPPSAAAGERVLAVYGARLGPGECHSQHCSSVRWAESVDFLRLRVVRPIDSGGYVEVGVYLRAN